MSELQLPSGAYIISNKETKTCLEYRSNEIRTATEDALRRREQQIWWVEVIPGYEDAAEGPVYSIQNLPAELGLDTTDWGKKGTSVVVNKASGQPWQMWWIKRVLDDKDGEFYNIISIHKNGTLAIDAHSEPLDSAVCTSDSAAENQRQRWKFVIPIVAMPPGWVQIRNAADGSFLQQAYVASPPFLAHEPHPTAPLNDRRNWGSQWLFLLEDGKADSPQCYWSIKNRLTGGFLTCQERWEKNGRIINVASGAIYRHGSNQKNQMWSFEIQRDGYWSIVNKQNSWVLEKVEGDGTEVTNVRKDSGGSDRRKWELVEWRKRVRRGFPWEQLRPISHVKKLTDGACSIGMRSSEGGTSGSSRTLIWGKEERNVILGS